MAALSPIGAILHLEADAAMAQALAECIDVPALAIAVHTFPDGEIRVTVPQPLPARVAILATLDHPNPKLVTLLLAARTARELGCADLTLVAPYLCYMRQDAAFAAGEAVSQRIVGRFLADLFDAVITVDPHLHRTDALRDAVPAKRALALSAAPLLGRCLGVQDSQPVLVGPDAESAPWVAAAAVAHGNDVAVCRKTRRGDREVGISLPDFDFGGRHAIIVDDVASTGRTIAVTAQRLFEAGAARVDVAVTHALFAGDGLEHLRSVGVHDVFSTDTIAHETNRVSVVPMLAEALASLG